MKLPSVLAGPLLILAIVVLLLTLPVTLPIAILLGRIDRSRLRKAASAMRCVRCGHELGAAALDAAAAAAAEARRQQRPFHGFRRLAPRPDARCVGCGLFYRWNSRLRTLEAEPTISDDGTETAFRATDRPMLGMMRRLIGTKRILASAIGVLLSAGAAAAAGGVRLVAQPDLMPRVAAFPRVAPGEPQAARINQALEAADVRARAAAEACRADVGIAATAGLPAGGLLEPGRTLGWTRRIVVAMRGPRYLALVTSDDADCGGLHPNADSVALTYDLRTGRPPNWSVLLPTPWVQTMTIDRASEKTPRGLVGSPALRSLYLALAGKAIRAISPDCVESMNQMAGPFMLWPDARQGGLMVQPVGLPHAFAACGVPAVIGIDRLRRQGVQPALLDAIATARRAAIDRAPGR